MQFVSRDPNFTIMPLAAKHTNRDQAMDIRFIDSTVIRGVLTPDRCIRLLDEAMRQVSLGETCLPLRQAMPLPGRSGLYGLMPGYLGAGEARPECFGVKLISLFPKNPSRGLPSHLGLILLHEADSGKPLAILDADVITSLRTAAASALATRELSRTDARTLAVIGTGEEARSHIPAILTVRDIRSVLVWGRNPDRAAALCSEFARLEGVRCETRTSIEAAVREADIICTLTSAKTPVLRGAWIPKGAHVNLVGSSVPSSCEVDTETVVRGRVYVDYLESARNQAGELLEAIRQGVIDESHIVAEIGAVLLGKAPGRQSREEITIYKSLGILAQDLAASWFVYAQAEARDLGQVVNL